MGTKASRGNATFGDESRGIPTIKHPLDKVPPTHLPPADRGSKRGHNDEVKEG
jgi:hypothetical protein